MTMDETVRAFHSLYYSSGQNGGTWSSTFWMGIQTLKCPLDLWVYQEIIHTTRPDVIVECGTHMGGSALFMANMCDMIGNGRVISVDSAPYHDRPVHSRIEYVLGSSIDPEVISIVKAKTGANARCMVVLDSNHAMVHVLAEMRSYASLVTPGCYMIAEDTNVNGNPVSSEHGPGPAEAVRAFLSEDKRFTPDAGMEKFFMTFNPGGYLKRV